jgi:alpha-glucuronidase
MPKTPLAMEVQITKEYLGFATHLAYLGTMWEEALASDTEARGPGSTVAKVVEGALDGHRLTAMAGVANVGTDRNWSGSQFDQANWYAFGRLAWNPELSARAIAEEWTRMSWGNDPHLVGAIVPMMMGSRQAVVDYMTPLGLAHLMGSDHHYGPGPWINSQRRPEWNPVYYHKADAGGIGFDRTSSGTNAVAQYAPGVARRFADPRIVGDDYLLWFHHVPWGARLDTGRTLWDELVVRYSGGVDTVRQMRRTWASLAPLVDRQRHEEVAAFLAIQEQEASWWRDACIAYFESVSHRPLPAGIAPPAHPLGYYEALSFPHAPGQAR